jgi:hypothetical protein
MGQSIGFTVGVLVAPVVWGAGQEAGMGGWFVSVGVVCVVNHVALWCWERNRGDGGEGEDKSREDKGIKEIEGGAGIDIEL